ncbi:hypothetical protein H9P43_007744 [Blastocladiella emersonii ATCC 22665]|nr:hypothetical protein H9P43_007744 [Blastocladiella emersonii ATCC 22665]
MSLGRHLVLNTGAKIPALGLGTWQSKPNEVGNAVVTALDAGYRHLDLAHVYQNEAEIGAALKTWFAAHPDVKRSDAFITSKLWNTFHAPADVQKGLETSLRDLQLEYLDLYLIHWPIAFKNDGTGALAPKDADGQLALDTTPLLDTWKAMEALLASGKVKAIGVSNVNSATLRYLAQNGTVVPAVNQIELHPYLPQDELLATAKELGVVLTAYSPLGSTSANPSLRENEVIAEIAAKHGKTTSQVLISWAIQRGTTVIPKSVNADRVRANFNDFVLDEADMAKIAELGKVNLRTCDPKGFWGVDIFSENKVIA